MATRCHVRRQGLILNERRRMRLGLNRLRSRAPYGLGVAVREARAWAARSRPSGHSKPNGKEQNGNASGKCVACGGKSQREAPARPGLLGRPEHLEGAAPAPGRRVVALDGKALRGSFDHLDDRAAAQLLSAFAGEDALILAHQEIAEGDEVAAAQALIRQLGLSGVLFTADALHCQKNVRLRDRDRQRAPGAGEGQPAAPA